MEQIVIHVQDKEKARLLFEMLSALDFVDFIDTKSEEQTEANQHGRQETTDFFKLAGLWENREINLEMIREKAWPRQL